MLNYVNLINIHFWIHLVKTTTTTTLKSHHHFLHVVHRVLKRGSSSEVAPWSHMWAEDWKQLLPSTSFSSSYSCPKSSPPPFPEYTRQLSHLLGLTTGTPAITMEKFSFQNVSNRSRVYKPAPHSPEWAPCPSAFRQIWSKLQFESEFTESGGYF